MGLYTLLQKRETGYYFRQKVPLDLRAKVGKAEIIKSLQTKEKAEATRKHKEFSLECEKYFESLRSGNKPSQMPDIVDSSFKSLAEQPKAKQAKGGDSRTLEWLAEEWIKQKANPMQLFSMKTG